jgi:ABC-2 type transport system ATP-binding protein
MAENPKPVVSIDGLSRRFGGTLALDNISLTVQPGLVYGLVGANGAGKTTLIKHLLGLLKAQQGKVSVFGLDPVQHPAEVLEKIGYLSEHRDMPEWMRVDELLRYTSAFHLRWDQEYAAKMVKTFGLDTSKKIKQLSKGMRAQLGLIAAVSHRPELLLLDEPSTGLDAVVRRDILNEIIRTVADDGRTVIFSSHLLDEVEMMSDHVFMIDHGNLVLQGELDKVKQQHQLMTISFDSQPSDRLDAAQTDPPIVDGMVSAQRNGDLWKVVMRHEFDSDADLHQAWNSIGGRVTKSRSASLSEIFVAHVGRDRLETVEN